MELVNARRFGTFSNSSEPSLDMLDSGDGLGVSIETSKMLRFLAVAAAFTDAKRVRASVADIPGVDVENKPVLLLRSGKMSMAVSSRHWVQVGV